MKKKRNKVGNASELLFSFSRSIKLLRVICADDRDACEVVLRHGPKFSFVHRSQPNWTCPRISSGHATSIAGPNNSHPDRRADSRKPKTKRIDRSDEVDGPSVPPELCRSDATNDRCPSEGEGTTTEIASISFESLPIRLDVGEDAFLNGDKSIGELRGEKFTDRDRPRSDENVAVGFHTTRVRSV